MKLLFVAEGQTDIGSPNFAPPPRTATGTVFILARKVCPSIDDECLALYWRELARFPLQRKGNIYAARVAAAMALAHRYGCDGAVIVVDRESKDEDRLKEMEPGIQRGHTALGTVFPTVCGEAILSIEAWVLGSPTALAAVLKIDSQEILSEYKPHDVEELSPRSGKPEKHSKKLVEKIAKKGHREVDPDFHQEVAEHADIDELCRHCQDGFKPFADKLRAAFGPPLARD